MSQPLKFPALKDRVLAFGYDYLLISLYLIILSGITFLLMGNSDSEVWGQFFSSPFRADLVAFLTTILPLSLYFAITESSTTHASGSTTTVG